MMNIISGLAGRKGFKVHGFMYKLRILPMDARKQCPVVSSRFVEKRPEVTPLSLGISLFLTSPSLANPFPTSRIRGAFSYPKL